MTGSDDRDLYLDGWREGVRQAHIALQAGSVEEARAQLEELMVSDYRYRIARRGQQRRGGARV